MSAATDQFDTTFPLSSSRQPVLARNMVATSQPLAAQAGLQAMARGGNAIDAAIAAAITLTVVEPTMNGIGGDGFSLIWDGKQLHGLTASGRAPRAWTPQRFAGLDSMPFRGWDSVTVPGAVSQWVALSERFGRLPFEDLFEAGIRYARDGYAVSPIVARLWSILAVELEQQPGFREAFLRLGRAPRAGELWRFPEQAATLEEIARTKGESMYRGRLAAAIAAFARAHGGALDEQDLAAHRCDWVEPIATNYRGYTVHEIPPSGQGIAALIALGILEHHDVAATAPDSPERLHLQIEATRLAFADAYAHVGDPSSMRIKPEDLLAPAYLEARARCIDPLRSQSYAPGEPVKGGTVYLCTADAEGRMVSLIQSNFKGFGSGVVVPGTGIALQNRGWGFTLQPGHPNEVGPGKRPYHTIIPAFMSRQGRPIMAFGVMGGHMQPQGHMQLAMRYINDGLNPQACADGLRWRLENDGSVLIEAGMPQSTVDGLLARGHRLVQRPTAASLQDFGSAQAIARLSDDIADGYVAGSDRRRDGQAVGF